MVAMLAHETSRQPWSQHKQRPDRIGHGARTLCRHGSRLFHPASLHLACLHLARRAHGKLRGNGFRRWLRLACLLRCQQGGMPRHCEAAFERGWVVHAPERCGHLSDAAHAPVVRIRTLHHAVVVLGAHRAVPPQTATNVGRCNCGGGPACGAACGWQGLGRGTTDGQATAHLAGRRGTNSACVAGRCEGCGPADGVNRRRARKLRSAIPMLPVACTRAATARCCATGIRHDERAQYFKHSGSQGCGEDAETTAEGCFVGEPADQSTAR